MNSSLKTTLLVLLIGAFLCAFFAPLNSLANGRLNTYPIGYLAYAQGDVFYGGESKMKMAIEQPIYMNTIIETGADARALIMFIDNTQVTLGENAELTIDEFVFDPYDLEENAGQFNVTKGAFKWVSGLIGKGEDPDIQINTARGSIGIRGTEFWGGALADKTYGVYVFEGAIEFTSAQGVFDLPAHEGVILGTDEKPAPALWPNERIAEAAGTITFKNAKNLGRIIQKQRQQNVQRQHDYRAYIFPYKANPLEPRLKTKDQDFFSDDFLNKIDNQ